MRALARLSFGALALAASLFLACRTEAQFVTANSLQCVFAIQFGDSRGSSFAIEVGGRQYLVTARHVVATIRDDDEIQLRVGDRWTTFRVRRVPGQVFAADVAVLALPVVLADQLPLVTTMDGLAVGEEVHFLGYPYGRTGLAGLLRHDGGWFPVVKHGVVSGFGWENGVNRLYLDAHNNKGFSGGPIVKRRPDGSTQVVGVVSEYIGESEEITKEGNDTGLRYLSNTGILIGVSIHHVLDAIAKRPIGALVTHERPTP